MARRCKGDSAPFPTFAAENRFALCYYPRMTPHDQQRFVSTNSARLKEPLIRRFAPPSPTRGEGRAAPIYFFTIRRQCSHAARIKFSLASGVRKAEWADSVTFGSFVSG